MRKKGFTLIELLAVLVVLAIIALITIPIVVKIISNSEEQSEKQSVLGYARAAEESMASWKMMNPGKAYNEYGFTDINYKGNTVICSDESADENGIITLTDCYVTTKSKAELVSSGQLVSEGQNKRHYNYVGGKVENASSSSTNPVYSIGDTFILEGDTYYVIKDSGRTKNYVTALKANPLTAEEVRTYNSVHLTVTEDADGYGGIIYGSTNDYDSSGVKAIVDAWAASKFTNGELKTVGGYDVRLLSLNDLTDDLGHEILDNGSTIYAQRSETTPSWIYLSRSGYWTMTPYDDSEDLVWHVFAGADANVGNSASTAHTTVRPVINVLKSKISD